jgi:hypothetical protein
MLRLLVKLALAALLANAVWRVGSEYLTDYQFKDAVRNAATFQKGTEDLTSRIQDLASEYGIELEEGGLSISSDESRSVDRSVVEVSYVKRVLLFPGYLYPLRFAWTVDTIYSKRF